MSLSMSPSLSWFYPNLSHDAVPYDNRAIAWMLGPIHNWLGAQSYTALWKDKNLIAPLQLVLSSVLCKVLGIGKKQLELSDTLVKPLQLDFLTLSHPGQINFGMWAGSSLIPLC